MRPFHAYLLKCCDGSYYAGHTDDLAIRMLQHSEGKIGYTSTRKPQTLVWQGEFETREGALDFELQIKGWSRAKKEALIRGDWERVQSLARNRENPSTSSGRTGGGGVSGPESMHGASPSTGSGRTGVVGAASPALEVVGAPPPALGVAGTPIPPFGLSLSKPCSDVASQPGLAP
ncbi:MAG: GIY-YIG nuclease family protein [Comamonadaceae bacterium]|nr:MAG: GIY-YIG nuclease family protein [Comamonadaceae bacterium]